MRQALRGSAAGTGDTPSAGRSGPKASQRGLRGLDSAYDTAGSRTGCIEAYRTRPNSVVTSASLIQQHRGAGDSLRKFGHGRAGGRGKVLTGPRSPRQDTEVRRGMQGIRGASDAGRELWMKEAETPGARAIHRLRRIR